MGCYWQMCHTHYSFYPPVCCNIHHWRNPRQSYIVLFALNSSFQYRSGEFRMLYFSERATICGHDELLIKYLAHSTKRHACDCHARESFPYSCTKSVSAWNGSRKTPCVRSVVMQASKSSHLQGKNIAHFLFAIVKSLTTSHSKGIREREQNCWSQSMMCLNSWVTELKISTEVASEEEEGLAMHTICISKIYL